MPKQPTSGTKQSAKSSSGKTEAPKQPLNPPDGPEAARVLLGAIAAESEFSESGSRVHGQLSEGDAKFAIYKAAYPKATLRSANWGQLIAEDTPRCLAIEESFQSIVASLETKRAVYTTRDVFNELQLRFTPIGYRRYLSLSAAGADVAQLAELPQPPTPSKPATPTTSRTHLKLSDERRKNLKADLLALIYDFNARFNKKITVDELVLRYAAQGDSALKRFNSWRAVTDSKDYDPESAQLIEKLVRAEVLEAYRDNIVDYEFSTSFVRITSAGQAMLGAASGAPVQPIAPKIVTTRIFHLSDLHFGSHQFTAIDNKDDLPKHDIAQLELPIFKNLASKIGELASADSLLVVSGDITSKNEESGYSDFATFLQQLPFGRERIYLIPGNHDMDRKATAGRMQYAGFLTFLGDYAHPLSQTPYLLDSTTRTFILGFNSVHISATGDELFYVSQDEITRRGELVRKLESTGDIKNTLRIAVIHNSMLPHSNVEIKKYSELLNLFRLKYELIGWGFSTVLSGHKHDPLFERHQTYAAEGSGALLLMSAPTAAGKVTGSKNGFHVIDYERDANTGALLRTIVTLYEVDRLGSFQQKESLAIENR